MKKPTLTAMAFVCHQPYCESGLTKKQILNGQLPSHLGLWLYALVGREEQNQAHLLTAGPAAQSGGNYEMLFPRN